MTCECTLYSHEDILKVQRQPTQHVSCPLFDEAEV